MNLQLQTEYFSECIGCGQVHASLTKMTDQRCVDCGQRLVAVGGVVDGLRIDIPLRDDERQRLRENHDKG